MSNADRTISQYANGAEPSAEATGEAGELKRLLTTIGDQIAGADRQHDEVLRQMQDRLAQLGADARSMRSQVPAELASAFERIEDSMSQLADRISHVAKESHPAAAPAVPAEAMPQAPAAHSHHADASRYSAENAPMPLRSAVTAAGPRGEVSRPYAHPANVDTFDVVDASMPGSVSEPWDEASAEALTRSYEMPIAFQDAPGAQTAHHEEPAPAAAPAAAYGEVHPAFESQAQAPFQAQHAEAHHELESSWLEDRFAEIALRIEQSLNEFRPDETVAALGERFDQFEQRLGVAFEEVATRTDLEGLRVLEAHMEELARHLEATHAQLMRLDVIEAQLHDVMAQLSDERMSGLMVPAAAGLPDADEMAARVASAAASRIAEIGRGAGGDDAQSLDEMKNLLLSFVDERRLGDEHTNSMLDTMQQALIRVLDRMDAMEVQQQRAVIAAPVRETERRTGPAERRTDAADEAVFGEEPVAAVSQAYAPRPAEATPQAAVHPAYDRPSPAMAAAAATPAPQPAMPPSAPARLEEQHPAMAVPSTPIEKLRQDFIQEARRAKQKAASEAPPPGSEIKAVRASVAAAAAGKPAAPEAAEEKAGYKKIFGLSPKLIVSALALIVAVNGALLFMSRKSGPKPQPPAAAMSAPVPKTQGAPANAQPAAEAPAAAVPGARSDAAPVADETAPAPAAKRKLPVPTGDPDLSNETVERILPEQQNMIIDGTTLSVPKGINLRRSPEPLSGAEIARVQQQQTIAETSNKLAATMLRATPAAFLPGEADSAGAKTGPAPSVPVTGAQSTSTLDLPPATVGPLSLRLAAAKGDPSAEFEVASRMAEGKGTDQNFKEALRWYQRSASQGFAQAQYRLGTLFERGLGAKKDPAMARTWYERAAEQGNVKAMHNLAVLSAGQESGAPDYGTAAQWFGAAAEHNLADSQYNLAVLAENGLGIAKDTKAAYKWYSLAAKGGDKEAVRRRDALRAQLSGTELSAAEQLVESFEAKRPDLLANDARAAGEDWKKRQGSEANG